MSIEIINLNKNYGSFQALKNINVSAPGGSLVSLLGPSGCGKTTLLRIIAGLEYADCGRVVVAGDDVTDLPAQKRNIGFMFQSYALFRHMTIFDNIAFGLTVMPRRQRPSREEIRDTVHRLLDLIKLPHIADRYPYELSGGQRQRVALARALAVRPRLLLLDEPFAALDAKVRKELRQWLLQIHHELGMTSILVTHDQEEALELSDQIVLMNHGVVEQVGEGDCFFNYPQSPFVSHFMQDVAIFEGHLADGRWHYGNYSAPAEGVSDSVFAQANARGNAHIATHQWLVSSEHEPDSMLEGELAQVHNLGSRYRLVVDVTGLEDVLIVLIPPEEQGRRQFKTGGRVYLKPRTLRVFPA